MSMSYGTPAWRIKAYTYNADIYCSDCMWEIVCGWVDIPQDVRGEMREMSTEDALDVAAKKLGIDRYDERSFDSGDFPKVVSSSQVCDEEHEHCGACRTDLCGE